jgi:putative copper export protein
VFDQLLTWTVRSAHVLGAALWVGGYAIMLLVFVPYLARERNETVRHLALATTRIISFAGALTIVAGLALIWRSRGFGSLLVGEWGGIVMSCVVLAFALMGVGDSGLRPALRRLNPDEPASVGPVRRWAMIGLGIGFIALLMMTRAIYARS